MLTPRTAPLSCYGLDQDVGNAQCRQCPHFVGCRESMGMRADRVTLDRVSFELIPDKLRLKPSATGDPIEALYQANYRLVYGSNPNLRVGQLTDRLLQLARAAQVSVEKYILINMVGFQLTWPEKEFRPGNLVDGRALHRVKTYAEACVKKFGTIDATALDHLTGQDNGAYRLQTRMLDTEIMVGTWIIEWKMDNEGPPYGPLFDALETELDVNWLAIEARYAARLVDYTGKPGATSNSHEIADKVRVLKRRKHECYANFAARQEIMPLAVSAVLGKFGYGPEDFERKAVPVTDPLQFWHRLALAMQHVEVLRLLYDDAGYYANSDTA